MSNQKPEEYDIIFIDLNIPQSLRFTNYQALKSIKVSCIQILDSFLPMCHLGLLKSVKSALSHPILISVARTAFTRFLVEHGLFQYYSY